jgi:8-oxo-dGTP pyrophosphatase MutT (NUDIX family)
MGRRGIRARFKPGVYVFPGGTLERADYRAKPLNDIGRNVIPHLAVAASLSRANALAMTSVRECYEETGLTFGSSGNVGNAGHPSWDVFQALGMSPDLRKLDFLGRAITPTYHSIRFHARFFAIAGEQMHGSLGGDGELEDLRWVRIDRLHGIETTIIQRAMLETLGRRILALEAPPRKLFYAWGRHNFVDL